MATAFISLPRLRDRCQQRIGCHIADEAGAVCLRGISVEEDHGRWADTAKSRIRPDWPHPVRVESHLDTLKSFSAATISVLEKTSRSISLQMTHQSAVK